MPTALAYAPFTCVASTEPIDLATTYAATRSNDGRPRRAMARQAIPALDWCEEPRFTPPALSHRTADIGRAVRRWSGASTHSPSVRIEHRKAKQRCHQPDGQQATAATANEQQSRGRRPDQQTDGPVRSIGACPPSLLKRLIIGTAFAEPVQQAPRPACPRGSHRGHSEQFLVGASADVVERKVWRRLAAWSRPGIAPCSSRPAETDHAHQARRCPGPTSRVAALASLATIVVVVIVIVVAILVVILIDY